MSCCFFFFSIIPKKKPKQLNPSGRAEEMLSFYIHKSKQQHIFVCECTKVEAAPCLAGCTRCLGTPKQWRRISKVNPFGSTAVHLPFDFFIFLCCVLFCFVLFQRFTLLKVDCVSSPAMKSRVWKWNRANENKKCIKGSRSFLRLLYMQIQTNAPWNLCLMENADRLTLTFPTVVFRVNNSLQFTLPTSPRVRN